MSQSIHTILDLSRHVTKLSFRDAFRDVDSNSAGNTSVRLSEEQLSSLVLVLFTYGLHYEEVSQEQRPFFMESIKDYEHGMFDIPLTFCAHLLNNLDEGARLEFRELLGMQYDLKDVLSNERLMDFVEMELIDPSVSYRKWEYGRYAMDHMAKELPIEMDWEAERSRIAQNDISVDAYLSGFENGLEKFGTELDDHEKGFLVLVAKTKILEQQSTVIDYMLVGDIVQSNLVGLHLRKEKLVTVLRTTIENNRSKGKDRGGPKP